MARILRIVLVMCMISGCSDDTEVGPDGATGGTDGGVSDGGGADKGQADRGQADRGQADTGKADTGKADKAPDTTGTITEKEPNNGTTKTEFQTVSSPMIIKGAIGTADDIDLFGLKVQAGQRLVVEVTSGGTMQAHLAVFDLADKLPAVVSAGPGPGAIAEYYALKDAATLLVGVRDRRNVGSSQHVGGAKFTYTLSILPLKRAPIPMTTGSTKSSTLAPAGTVRVFSFKANKGDNWKIRVLASQLSPPSDVDSRLSLFCVDQKSWHGTNDNASGAGGDSLIQGAMPYTCTYHAVVENVQLGAAKLGFALKITKQ